MARLAGVEVLLRASLRAVDLDAVGLATLVSLVLPVVAKPEPRAGRAPLTICRWPSDPPGITMIGLL